MNTRLSGIEAVTLDFYNTLVFHKEGSGRGATLMEYLESHGLGCDPWEHQVLYDLFENHATDYSPDLDARDKQAYLEKLTGRLFERLNVQAPAGAAADHAHAVWRLLGPQSLGVYREVPRVLHALKRAGYPVSVVSNWQCGLQHFCRELGIAANVGHVVSSAELGFAKPDPQIFREACRLMRVECDRVLHVGDSLIDDVHGGRGVGMEVLLIQRDGELQESDTPTIRSLDQLVGLLSIDSDQTGLGDYSLEVENK